MIIVSLGWPSLARTDTLWIHDACALHAIRVRLSLAVALDGFDADNVAGLNIAQSAKGEIAMAGDHRIAIAADG